MSQMCLNMAVLFWSHGGGVDSSDGDSSGGNHDFYGGEGDSSDTDDDSQPPPPPDVGDVHGDAMYVKSKEDNGTDYSKEKRGDNCSGSVYVSSDSMQLINDNASLKTIVDAEHAQEDTTFDQPFVLLLLWPSNSPFSLKISADKENQEKEACDAADVASVIKKAFKQKCYDQGGAPISSSTKTFSDVHIPVNTADDEIPELVEINNDHNYGIFTHSSYDDENWDF
ncbi:hypothetical protein Tco_0826229 [Tanacetum coccineum]